VRISDGSSVLFLILRQCCIAGVESSLKSGCVRIRESAAQARLDATILPCRDRLFRDEHLMQHMYLQKMIHDDVISLVRDGIR